MNPKVVPCPDCGHDLDSNGKCAGYCLESEAAAKYADWAQAQEDFDEWFLLLLKQCKNHLQKDAIYLTKPELWNQYAGRMRHAKYCELNP